ncbi:MAG: cytochrome C biogenesis protein CcdA, partial [Rhodobacterales bacterium]
MRAGLLALVLLAAAPAAAVQPDEVLPDPALESRARDLAKNL